MLADRESGGNARGYPWAGRPRCIAALVAPALVAALAAIVACGRPAPDASGKSIWLGQGPVILSEERQLTHAADSGNRFLRGWVGEKRGERIVYCPAGELARLEITNLEDRRRQLTLHLADDEPPFAEGLRARAAGRDLDVRVLGRRLEIDLVQGLPHGRFALDLRFGGARRCLIGASLQPVLAAGSARIEEDGALLQSGNSVVEFVVPQDGRAALAIDFEPPAHPAAGQSFSLTVEDEAGRVMAEWGWPTSRWPRWQRWSPRRAQARLDLAATSGFLRCRLSARGEGPPGRWRRVALSPEPAPPSDSPARPGGPPPSRILVVVLDALRADFVGYAGRGPGPSPRATPTLDRLASEGLAFLEHRSVAPNTLPATKALFTGETPVVHGGRKLAAGGQPTLAERLRAAGYRTGLFSGNENVSPTFGLARGFDFDAAGIKHPPEPGSPPAAFNDNAARVYRAARAWLRQIPRQQPAFLYLHTIHPHNPYDPPPDLRARFTAGIASRIAGSTAMLRDLDRGRARAGAADRDRLRGLYAGGLAYNDRELATLLTDATAGYGPGEVAVIVTADHGEELFDHGGVLHGYTLYEEMLRIPLLVWWPGRLEVDRVGAPTNTLDLARTLLEIAGAQDRFGDGESLFDIARAGRRNNPVWFAAASSLRGGIFSAQSPRYKLILAPRTGLDWGMGSGPGRSRDLEYLFDLEQDPQERHNLAGERIAEADWLRGRLLDWIARNRAREDAGANAAAEPQLTEEAQRRLRALGYLD